MQAGLGIDNEDLWRLATGLGAGLSRRQTVCGALTGAALGCGLILGRGQHGSREDRTVLREETYAAVAEISSRFEQRFGSIECRALTGCDFATAEGRSAFKDAQQMERTCRPAVRFAVDELYARLKGLLQLSVTESSRLP